MSRFHPKQRTRARYEILWPDDPDHAYLALTLMGWLERLIGREGQLDRHLATALVWLLDGELEPLFDRLLSAEDREKLDMWEDSPIHDVWEGFLPGPPVRRPNLNVARELFCLSRDHGTAFREELGRALARRRDTLRRAPRSAMPGNLKRVRKILGLTVPEAKLFLLSYLAATCPPVDDLFGTRLGDLGPAARRFLALLLGLSQKKARETLTGRFPKLGMLAHPGHSIAMDSSFWVLLEESPDALMERHAFRKLPDDAPPLEDYELPDRTLGFIVDMLRTKPADGTAHLLLVGPPGGGKTSLIRALVARAGVHAFEVNRASAEYDGPRSSSLVACLHMTNHGDGSVIVVDDADELISTERGWMVSGNRQDYSGLNQLLDRPGSRLVFIVNSLKHIAPAVLRRFSFILRVPRPGQRQRRRIWRAVMRRRGLDQLVDDVALSTLAADYPVTAGLMDRAVATALHAGGRDPERLVQHVRLALDSYLEAMGKPASAGSSERVGSEFTLEGLNVSGDLEVLLDDLRTFDRCLRDGAKSGPRNMTLLFSGPPGTGKSELARHAGETIDREVVVLRSSDLMSKYVGETEKKVAGAFRRAESSGAVLVFDEADSLLFSREAAVRSWEVSYTNEVLTRMERFRGVMICTTNRLTGMDPASLRRFTHKLAFDHLTPEGNEVFYGRYLLDMSAGALSDSDRRALRGLMSLAPGDFRVVRDRFAFREPDTVTHARLIEALAEEAGYKADTPRRAAGFGRHAVGE